MIFTEVLTVENKKEGIYAETFSTVLPLIIVAAQIIG